MSPDKTTSAKTDALAALRGSRPESLDSLMALTYDELRRIARRHLARGRRVGARSGTLGTTALVNEAYLELVDQSKRDPGPGALSRDRRRRHAAYPHRSGAGALGAEAGRGNAAVTLDADAVAGADDPQSLLDINDALDRVALIDARLARVVECRFFGGLSEEEIAEVLGVTVRTVQRDWARARMLLRRELSA